MSILYFIGDTKTTPSDNTPPNNSNNTGSGLIAYYPFNGNANDASGNNNQGRVNGATLSNDRFGVANKAYKFSDGNEIVVRNNNGLNLPNAFTFNLWVNMLSTTGRNGNNAITTNSKQCIFTKNCDGGHLRCAIYPQSNGTFLLETYANTDFKLRFLFNLISGK